VHALQELRQCHNVLEIGCGTGVILRELLRDPGFSGSVTGVDQSTIFLEAARRLAEEEGCPPDRMSFVLADAQEAAAQPTLPGGGFDAVVMHTLISHTSTPVSVLEQAAEWTAPGELLVSPPHISFT
jgi:ubiquinone/menaquinone biosynthesis C-methylase UbiE